MGEIVNKKEIIAARVAKEFKDGFYVNLGIGIPSLVVNYLPEGVNILLHGEGGILGMGERDKANENENDGNLNCIDAGGSPVKTVAGASFFDSLTAFSMARGGHLNCTVLGALQVDSKGNLANWWIPGVKMPGMGGAMDILVGARRVIVAMEHTAKGNPKILSECTLPLTAVHCVDLIVTELAVIKVKPQGLELLEYNPNCTIDEIQKVTAADLLISDSVKPMF